MSYHGEILYCKSALRGKAIHLLEVPNGSQLTARKLDGNKILIEVQFDANVV